MGGYGGKWYSSMVFIYTRIYVIPMQKIHVVLITSAAVTTILVVTPGIIGSYLYRCMINYVIRGTHLATLCTRLFAERTQCYTTQFKRHIHIHIPEYWPVIQVAWAIAW